MRDTIDTLCMVGVIFLPAFLWVIWNTPPTI